MPKCKYCKSNITKFDTDICPVCGGKKPLDGNSSETCDITQVIEVQDAPKVEQFKQHSRVVNAFLMMFLGIFGIDEFYLGFKKEGFIRIAFNIGLLGIIFSCLYFPRVFIAFNHTDEILFCSLLPIVSTFVIYFILGIVNLFIKSKKDAKGVFLK